MSKLRIGLMQGTSGPTASLDEIVATAKQAESLGFSTLWFPNIFSWDAIALAAIVGRETERIELGTAVVPTYPRHPMAIAQTALTASAASGGRFTLGIGLSHKIVIEDMFGLSYAKPARHMREYLEVLTPLLRGEPAKFEGELYRVQGGIQVPGASQVPLVVAALGPVMLDHTANYADGTITWMTGPKTLAEHIVPTLTAAAGKRGKGAPRVVAGLPIALTNDVDAARENMGKAFAMYGTLPSYRAMLDREGVEGPAGVAMVGDEKSLRAQIDRLADAGVTDFDAAITPVDEGAAERTLEFLASLN
ncbi:MAG: LLM class F420-dependent oxidoreductase [Myxococcota bacterium]